MQVKLAIVDDKSINRNTIKDKLQVFDHIQILWEAANGELFLEKMASAKATALLPDVVLMDLDMPVMDGIEAIRIAAPAYPATKFIVLTIFEDAERIFEAIKAGANGYLLKDDRAIEIEEAIRQVVEFNGIPMSPVIARKAMDLMLGQPEKKENHAPVVDLGLSEREIDILKALASGATYQVIGERLFISPLTVRKHVSNLYEKLHVRTRMQIVEIGKRNKLI